MTFGKWFVYIIVFALLPILLRLGLAGAVWGRGIHWVTISDVVAFGLTLAITNIAGLETSAMIDDPRRPENIGISVVLVSFFSALVATYCFMELPSHPIDEDYVLSGAILLSIFSIALSRMIWNRILLFLKKTL